MLADFKIVIHSDPERTIRVVVHDSIQALRSAATRYDRTRGLTGDNSEVLGICHRFTRSEDSLCAIVRLAPPNLGAGLIAHELAHAAVWIREIYNHDGVALHTTNDEEFCWLLGELVQQTVTKLYALEVYENA